MSLPNTVAAAEKALAEAVDKGSHSVRVSTELLTMLLNSYALLSAAFAEIENKADNGED